MNSEIMIGILGLIGTLATGYFAYRAGIVKTFNDGENSRRDDKRDDFTVIVDKFKEIIGYQEEQITKQAAQIDRQDDQIKKLIRENDQLKRQSKLLISEIHELKDALQAFPNIDATIIDKINRIHEAVVSSND